ncbi:variable surface lipoprotein [Metamycoplasma alkalescens]|uniref:variable surface lipoprotein n=1 Tax=Metamycoplasma alkalescens TaxID=45363 RepID=UPI003D03A73E
MKKSSKLLLSLSSISVVSLPLLAISCTETEKQLFEKEIKKVKEEIAKMKDGKVKSALQLEVRNAEKKISELKTDEEFKKARREFKDKVDKIKRDGENTSNESKEDKLAKELRDILELKKSEKVKLEDISQKKLDLYYSFSSNSVVAVEKGKIPNWTEKDPDKKNHNEIFSIKSNVASKLGRDKQRLVNADKPTIEDKKNKNRMNLSSMLDYEIKNVKENSDKSVEFEIIVKYKVATFGTRGKNHVVSNESNQSTLTLTFEKKS